MEAIPVYKPRKRVSRSAKNREYILSLLRLLASKMDSIARYEIYQQDAAEHSKREYEKIYEEMKNSDLAHIEWLKKQITREIRDL